MYEAYWGLKDKPFENTPDPRFIYLSHEHLEAATRLTYVIKERKGAALLTGEYGCGKTIMSRLIFEILPQDKYEIALVTNPMLNPLELLREICLQLGIKISKKMPKTKLLKELNQRFYENMNKGRDTVLIIDEAQAIRDRMAFEELRLLLNFQLNNRFLLTLILIGQPELRKKIDELKQLKQRLTLKYHLNPLNKEDTEKYIVHRLTIAGTKKKIFVSRACGTIWEEAEGVPRMINSICDMCLLVGYTKGLKEISADMARRSAHGLDL
ncbi:MAG: AAA family ATPase [Candidatus Bathyarchaeota archaeon]|nr:AAA family ATPase [Candidatus Bathyarchaeota archaeon]